MEKGNVVIAHKKEDKENLKNYGAILLLLVARKIFERILYNNIYEFFTENNLMFPNQLGFKPSDPAINFYLSLKKLTNYLTIALGGGISLDISKALDKVWQKGLLYKLKQYGISAKFFDIITYFLNFRVVLNGQYFSWTSTEADASRINTWTIILLIFFININDLSNNLATNIKLFADDTTHFSVVHNVNTSTNNLNNDLNRIRNSAI